MDSIKSILKNTLNAIGNFLKYKKHLYVKPLFFIIIALGIVLLAVYFYKAVIHEPEELITMDFSQNDQVSYDFSGTTIALDPGHGGSDPEQSSSR